jgi:hypothetical protein
MFESSLTLRLQPTEDGPSGIQKPSPRDSGLTRFATQILFPRALQQQILVSIIPDRDASREHINLAAAWSRTVPELDPDTFT